MAKAMGIMSSDCKDSEAAYTILCQNNNNNKKKQKETSQKQTQN